MKLIQMIAGNLLVLVLVFPYAVFAKEFKINVKVDIKDLHEEVQTVRILCNIQGANQATLALGNTDVNNIPSGGSLYDVIQVIVNVDPYNPAEVSGYTCALKLSRNGTNFLFPAVNTASQGSPYYGQCDSAEEVWRCLKGGPAYTLGFSGLIP